MSEKRYRVMNHDDYELDYIADSQQGFKKVDLYDCCDLLNENEQLKQQLKLKEAEERINCRNCIYFISGSSSDRCLKREDIGYKGTCIDGMDYHYLAKNCPYYEKGDVE